MREEMFTKELSRFQNSIFFHFEIILYLMTIIIYLYLMGLFQNQKLVMNKIKILPVILLTFFISASSFAQNSPKDLNEIRLSYGAVTNEQIAILFLTTLGSTIGGIFNENVSKIDGTFIGPIMIQYQRSIKNSNFTIGGLFGYSSANTDVEYSEKPNTNFHFNISYFTLMCQGEYNYINTKNFQLYSGVGIGTNIIIPTGNDPKGNSTPTNIGAAVQFSPIGLKFGGENIGGNIEFGYGSKGIVNAGLYTRF
jgi:hypothetical protein